MNKNISEPLAEHIYKWLKKQRYNNESLLHAAVCCDFVGKIKFKRAITEQIDIFMNEKNLRIFLKNEDEKLK